MQRGNPVIQMGDTMQEPAARIDVETLERFMRDVFIGLGTPSQDAAICADVLISADKRGIDSHGVARLKTIYYDRIRDGIVDPVTRIDIVRENPTTAVVDGGNGLGQVVGRRCMELAMEKAKTYGMGMVAARNSNHYGIAGYYVLMAANADMIGFTGTNARPSQAPTFGVENMLGTNPITIGMPTDEEFPFVLDCATSTTQRGKVEVYAREGRELPDGWVVGQDGRSQTNAKQVLDDLVAGTCALTPLGGIGEEHAGYKGYGYATAVELLSAALQGGRFLKMLSGFENGRKVPYGLGHFFIAIDTSAFTEPSAFRKTAGEILRALRTSKKMPGESRIYTAGEKEHLAWLTVKDNGVPVVEETRREMIAMRNELGLVGYDALFAEA
jgi:LDH2 family malate/lactate/ureidoglycolate dehydrogenase